MSCESAETPGAPTADSALHSWPAPVHLFAEIDSTNRWIRDEASLGRIHHGAVAIADLQTAGRGRLDRRWVAPPKSALLMSVLVDASVIGLPIDRWPLVSLCMAVAVADASNDAIGARDSGEPTVVLKWPNDVIVVDSSGEAPGYRKMSGILVEVSSGRLVVGVGVNLQQPPEIDPTLGVAARPVWLSECTTHTIDRDSFARAVLDAFFGLLAGLQKSPTALLTRYRSMVATIGWMVRIESQGRKWTARAVDIDDAGRLVVLDERGTHHLDVSEVVHVRPMF